MMEGDGAMSLDAEGEGERRGYNLSREALERLIEAARRCCSVSGFREYEKFKSLPCFAKNRIAPCLLRSYKIFLPTGLFLSFN